MELNARFRVPRGNGEGAGEGRERRRSRAAPYPPQGKEREGAASTRWSAAWRQWRVRFGRYREEKNDFAKSPLADLLSSHIGPFAYWIKITAAAIESFGPLRHLQKLCKFLCSLLVPWANTHKNYKA